MSRHHHHKRTGGGLIRAAALCGGERWGFGAGGFRVHVNVVSATKLYRSLLPHLKAATRKAYFTHLQECTKIIALKVLSQNLLKVRC